jgi:hypothetical protein
VQIEFSSQDETIILSYLATNFGLCPTETGNVHRFATINGRIRDLRQSRTELKVDIGIVSPTATDASVPLPTLQAQMVDGRKSPLRIIGELFGLCDNMPFDVKIANIDQGKNSIQAMPSEKQLQRYRSWTETLLDKLLVLGASTEEVESTIRAAELTRDIVTTEPLALFDHVITCKLGTDAKGLIPKIGGKLRRAFLSVFSPRRILEFFDDEDAILAK